MALTATEIAQLNNAMEANQRIALGTLLEDILDDLVDAGSVTPSTSRQVVTTGLSTVDYAVCSLSGSPVDSHIMSIASSGSVAGTVVLNQYVMVSGSWASDYTLASGSTSDVFAEVSWIATGER